MKCKQGFTLVELLVVVAIITILASIVVPNVIGFIAKARVAKALAEIKGAELAMTKMLTDSGKSSFSHFFNPLPAVAVADTFYTEAFYTLLRQGRDAVVPGLREDVRKKLGSQYMDLGKDPWGGLYHFNLWTPRDIRGGIDGAIIFRTYKPDFEVPPLPQADRYTLGNLGDPDNSWGYPAPTKLPIYIYSAGADQISAQVDVYGAMGANAYSEWLPDIESMGGGDDINNWDKNGSWQEFYD